MRKWRRAGSATGLADACGAARFEDDAVVVTGLYRGQIAVLADSTPPVASAGRTDVFVAWVPRSAAHTGNFFRTARLMVSRTRPANADGDDMHRPRVLALRALLSCLAALTGCGDGSGVTQGPALQSIFIDVQDDALVTASLLLPWDATGITLTSISVGDDTQGNAYRGLMRFPLGDVPAGANVVGAKLHVRFNDRRGSPGAPLASGGLGNMQFHRIAGGPLSVADFGAPSLAHDPAADLTSDIAHVTREIGALALVQSALGTDTDLKIRVAYQALSNHDGVLDQMRLGTRANASSGAVLEVVIQP